MFFKLDKGGGVEADKFIRHPLNFRLDPPIVIVSIQRDILAGYPLDEFVRACADGARPKGLLLKSADFSKDASECIAYIHKFRAHGNKALYT